MPREVIMHTCEGCEQMYEDQEEAEECEKHHTALANLGVSAVKFEVEDLRFPSHILIEDSTYSGEAAQYKLERVSSVEDFDVLNGGIFWENEELP